MKQILICRCPYKNDEQTDELRKFLQEKLSSDYYIIVITDSKKNKITFELVK